MKKVGGKTTEASHLDPDLDLSEKDGKKSPEDDSDQDPDAATPLLWWLITPIGIVIAVVDEIIRNCMPVTGVELLE